MTRSVSFRLAMLACAALASCDAILGIGNLPTLDGGSDASAKDVVSTDALGDAQASGDADASADADADAQPTVYNDMTNSSFWSAFDTATLDAGPGGGFFGGAFDGRYVYLAPFSSTVGGPVTRLDTTGTFTSPSSWDTFDTSTLSNPTENRFIGAVYDGQRVMFVPYGNAAVAYDTEAGAFQSASSWETTSAVRALRGATFDGRYAYLVPTVYTSGLLARHDMQSPLGGGWTNFDTTTIVDGGSFTGAIFDGQYIYVLPEPSTTIVMKHDTKQPLASSWSTFDLATLGDAGFDGVAGGSAERAGGGFDGRYLYITPANGVAARYDTTQSFSAGASWETFDLRNNLDSRALGFYGVAFDGRYIYFAPTFTPNGAAANFGGVIARYDTKSGFGSPSSWSVFDPTSLGGIAMAGAVFDGRYVYFIPGPFANTTTGTVVLRFDAKSPPSMPAGYSGSFL